jgi:hypothetical protein
VNTSEDASIDYTLGNIFECGVERSAWMVWLKVDPRFDPVRPDARFQNLLRRLGLPTASAQVRADGLEKLRPQVWGEKGISGFLRLPIIRQSQPNWLAWLLEFRAPAANRPRRMP